MKLYCDPVSEVQEGAEEEPKSTGRSQDSAVTSSGIPLTEKEARMLGEFLGHVDSSSLMMITRWWLPS